MDYNDGRLAGNSLQWKEGVRCSSAERALAYGIEGKVLFNDAINTFYLRCYSVRHNGKGPLR